MLFYPHVEIFVLIGFLYSIPPKYTNVKWHHVSVWLQASREADNLKFSVATGVASIFSYVILSNTEWLLPLWPLEL